MSHRRSQDQQNPEDLNSVWSSLGLLKAELRKMGHRLDGAGGDLSLSSGTSRAMPGISSLGAAVGGGDQPAQVNEGGRHSSPSRTAAAGSGAGARRKVNRNEDKLSKHVGTRQNSHRTTHNEVVSSSSGTSTGPGRGRESVRVNHDSHHQHHHHNQQQYDVRREESPKRVDFSRTHQLREVNWDGTYQDSLAYPADPDLSSQVTESTLTNSRDLRETDIRFLNFSRLPQQVSTSNNNALYLSSPPYAPPPSASNSSTTFRTAPSSSASASSVYSSTSSHSASSLSPSQPQKQQQSSQQPPDVRWRQAGATTTTTHAHSAYNPGSSGQSSNAKKVSAADATTNSSRSRTRSAGLTPSSNNNADSVVDLPILPPKKVSGIGPRLTSVEVRSTATTGSAKSGSRTSSSAGSSHRGDSVPVSGLSEVERRHRDFLQVRREVEDKWANAPQALDNYQASGIATAAATTTTATSTTTGGGGVRRGVLTMADSPLSGLGEEEGSSGASPRRPRPVKKPITADLKDNEIMLKLKERLKQQRALASSSSASGSNDTSLAESSTASLGGPPAIPPRQPLYGDEAPALPRSRKVAAAHPTPSYRGFSEATGESATTPKVKSAGVKKKSTTVKKGLQLQPKKYETEVPVQASSSRTNPPPVPERPKKARVIASADKKSSKSGAKNVITTSSWRLGQELVMKELGLSPKTKAKGSSTAGTASQEEGSTNTDAARRTSQPDGAEAATTGSGGSGGAKASGTTSGSGATGGALDPETEAVMANARALSEDARNILNELQLEKSDGQAGKSSGFRPAVKRKAPKSTAEPDKHQHSSEKSRHYDPDSVRKYMAKQKAERLKRQHEEKVAKKKDNEKRQQMLAELAEIQKKKAQKSASGRHVAGEAERKRHKGQGEEGPGKEAADPMDIDHEDDSTLTGGTEEESTPQATPRPSEERIRKRSKEQHQTTVTSTMATTTQESSRDTTGTKFIEFQGQKLNLDVNSVLSRFSQVVNQHRDRDAGVNPSYQPVNSGGFNVQSTVPGAHQAVPETAFSIGATNAMARTNEERKQAIKATALTLQARLAQERKRFESLEPRQQSQPNPSPEVFTRHDRIVGKRDEFTVFGSDLPGSHALVGDVASQEQQDQAAARIQAAYRGHNVRQALNWQLPSGQTFGHKLRGAHRPKDRGDDDDDASELTETSTFSEITATENSDGANTRPDADAMPGNKRPHGHSHHNRQIDGAAVTMTAVTTTTTGVSSKYQGPSHYTWDGQSHPDPNSIMSIFTRQAKYLAANVPTTTTSAGSATQNQDNADFIASLDLSSLKQPVISSEERVLVGQSASGQPIIAKQRYTRVEATVSEVQKGGQTDEVEEGTDNSENSFHTSAAQAQTAVKQLPPRTTTSLRSNDPHSHTERGHHQVSQMSAAAYTMSFESDEDEAAPTKHSTHKKSAVTPSFNRQVSDAGQETDVSQMSEDEPRKMRSKHEGGASAATSHGADARPAATSAGHGAQTAGSARGIADGQGGRLSPNSLANKFSANLNYLESMEESLRQVTGMERARAVALAQQETVSVAQVLKARQQEHEAKLGSLQQQVQQEAREATQQLDNLRSRPSGARQPSVSVASLLEKEDNLRPESRSVTSLSRSRSSRGEDLSQSPGNRRIKRSSATTSLASVTKFSTTSRSTRVKTADDTRNDSDSSIRTASDADAHDSRASESVPEEIAGEGESYSMSFDESVTDEESFRQVLPSESHRKEVRRQSGDFTHPQDVSANHITAYSDLSSLFVGEDSFNKFTAEMVRQVMREEETRAQHQAALLKLREKALKEKAKAELAWLQQLKQQPRDKRADDVFPNLDKKEKIIRRNLQEQQAEIRRLQEANKQASEERQRLLQQHEEIARIKQNTQNTLGKLKGASPTTGRLTRPSEVHTEDEIEEASDVSEDHLKDSKSDSEMYKDKIASGKGEKNKMDKLQKLRLNEKYMTVREHKLHERKRQAQELIEWKKKLDEEEAKVYQLERAALQVWGDKDGRPRDKARVGDKGARGGDKDRKREEVVARDVGKKEQGATGAGAAAADTKKKVSASRKDDSAVISDRMLSSMQDEMAPTRSRAGPGSVSEVISTQLSISEATSPDKKSRLRSDRSATTADADKRSPAASGSESSIPEELPSVSGEEKQKGLDSSDDTLINSSVNDDYADTFEQDASSAMASRKKSPVGRLLPQGNSPLPSPWSRKTGSESESEDSISHTETMSDASDYEVRIRQLGDELRRRRKEVEILKKERSKRQKEKLKAQEEALKKQLDAYNNYILQLKNDKDDLEHEPNKTAVKPQIKQPRSTHQAKGGKAGHRHGDEMAAASNSSSFEDMREGTESNQTSPNVESGKGPDLKASPTSDDKGKKKGTPVSLMDRISEGSESDKSSTGRGKSFLKKKAEEASEKSSSVAEVIEEASHADSMTSASDKTSSAALKIQTSAPAAGDKSEKSRERDDSLKDEDNSYSMDFSDMQSSLAQSQSRLGRSHTSVTAGKGVTESDISEHIDEPSSVSGQLKFDFRAGTKANQEKRNGGPAPSVTSPPSTGIQESDSETESRQKSEASSRPSSERSVGSMSNMDDEEEEEVEEDIISLGSDKTSLRTSEKLLPPVPGASPKADEEVSEHVSASLPSISEKRSLSLKQESQDILDDLLGYEEDEDDKTPVATPREMVHTPADSEAEEEEENASLLQTDPLADFHLGDHVLVWGRRPGVLRYKGKVDFSPGIWAGVELDADEGDSDGQHEGKRYFTCRPNHGVMVHGSDISARPDQPAEAIPEGNEEEVRSPDESITTDQEDSNLQDGIEGEKTILPARDASMLVSTPVGSPAVSHIQKPTATPVKSDMSNLADDITNHLTTTLVEDSFEAINKISATKKSPPSTASKSQLELTVNGNATVEDTKIARSPESKASPTTTDKTTDGVMKSLLDEAIKDMVNIKRKKAHALFTGQEAKTLTSPPSGLVNGDIGELSSFTDEDQDGERPHDSLQDSGLSMDHAVQRPGSPVPSETISAADRKELNDDLDELFGGYIDDEPGLDSGTDKSPPAYSGSGDGSQGFQAKRAIILEDVPPVVPHTRETIAPIVSQAIDAFWTRRRYGESLEGLEPSEDFLADDADEEETDALTTKSRACWKRMLFHLTGEVIRDVYSCEDEPEPAVWQKAKHKTSKYFKGSNPPTTVEGLRPVVQNAVFKLLDLNGTRKMQSTVNKWNIRKKKDAVDSVLVQELGEEERGWVDYSQDETNLKMDLADSLFDSLLQDTVQTLNSIYQRKQQQV